MNGRYRIPLGPDESPEQNPMVQKLLKMLDPGAAVVMIGGRDFVVIEARGGRPRKRAPARLTVSSAPLSAGSIAKRLAKAQDTLESARSRIRANLKRQYLGEGWQDRDWLTREVEKRAGHKRIGATVAKILARHHIHADYVKKRNYGWKQTWTAEDYADLDATLGRKVERASKVSEGQLKRHHGYLGWIVSSYAGSWRFGQKKQDPDEPNDPGPNAIQSMLEVKAEVEYLEELLRLATEREAQKGNYASV
jgi:hypothetical protein